MSDDEQQQQPIYSQAVRRQVVPPLTYNPTSFEYVYRNYGLPIYSGDERGMNCQHFNLVTPIKWTILTPANLWLLPDSVTLIKDYTPIRHCDTLNSVLYEMRRALTCHHVTSSESMGYIHQRSQLKLYIDDWTSVRVYKNHQIQMQPAAIFTRWMTCQLHVIDIRCSIIGLQKDSDGVFSLTIHVDTIMVQCDSEHHHHHYNNLNNSIFHVL